MSGTKGARSRRFDGGMAPAAQSMNASVAFDRRLLEHDVAKFFADAEAVYSYEGTHEITSLIVGRALTGASAFV